MICLGLVFVGGGFCGEFNGDLQKKQGFFWVFFFQKSFMIFVNKESVLRCF